MNIWSIAKCTASKEIEAKAQANVTSSANTIPPNERSLMRKAIERSGKLPDDEVPGAHYLTVKVDEVEQNEPKASPLDQIAHLEHATDVDMTVGLDNSGTFRTIRQKLKVDVPNDPEAYRKRMRVEMNLWLMLSARFMNKPWLEGTTSGPFDRFVNYILGKDLQYLRR